MYMLFVKIEKNKKHEKFSIRAGCDNFCPIITHSSILLTIPVAVPGVLLADGAAASLTDRGHSLRSLDSATGGAPIAPQLLSYIFLLFCGS